MDRGATEKADLGAALMLPGLSEGFRRGSETAGDRRRLDLNPRKGGRGGGAAPSLGRSF